MRRILDLWRGGDMDAPKELRPSAGDIAHTAAKAGLSLIPWVGGSAAEIFAAIVTPPLQKRRDMWIEDLAKELADIRESRPELHIDDLLGSDQFITATLHATQTALKNHQKEKLEALKNSVLNVAIGTSLDEDVQMVFLRYIDELTPWHLRILAYFQDPAGWLKEHSVTMPNLMMGGITEGVFRAFPELKKEGDLYQQIVTDLKTRGLLVQFSDATMSMQGILAGRTSELGRRFMAFIQSPGRS
jgi:hypothetical protein